MEAIIGDLIISFRHFVYIPTDIEFVEVFAQDIPLPVEIRVDKFVPIRFFPVVILLRSAVFLIEIGHHTVNLGIDGFHVIRNTVILIMLIPVSLILRVYLPTQDTGKLIVEKDVNIIEFTLRHDHFQL